MSDTPVQSSKSGSEHDGLPGLVPIEDEKGEPECQDASATPAPTKGAVIANAESLIQKGHKLGPLLSQALKSYAKFLSSAINQDKGLKFLQYTLWLASKIYSNKDSKGHKALTKLSLELCMARYVTRLLQFPTALEAVLHKSWRTPSPTYPLTFQRLGDILAWSMMLYYPAEHVAYLQWQAPDWLGKHKRSAEQWSAWSCRGWLVYVVAEMAQGVLQWKELVEQEARERLEQEENDTQEKTSDKRKKAAEAAEKRLGTAVAVRLEQQKQRAMLLATNRRSQRLVELQLVRNGLFLLPCIQYSLPNWDVQPWLPPDLVNALFWLESVVCLYQAVV